MMMSMMTSSDDDECEYEDVDCNDDTCMLLVCIYIYDCKITLRNVQVKIYVICALVTFKYMLINYFIMHYKELFYKHNEDHDHLSSI